MTTLTLVLTAVGSVLPLLFLVMKARKGHFFKTQMLVTQFETLQEPGAEERDVLVVDIDQPLEGVIDSTIELINKGSIA